MKKRSVLFVVWVLSALVGFDVGGGRVLAQSQSEPEVALSPSQGEHAPAEKTEAISLLKTEKDQVNYAIGVAIIGNFKKQGMDIDLPLVMKGMQDASSGEKLLLTNAELSRAVKLYYIEMRQRGAKIRATKAKDNNQKNAAP